MNTTARIALAATTPTGGYTLSQDADGTLVLRNREGKVEGRYDARNSDLAYAVLDARNAS